MPKTIPFENCQIRSAKDIATNKRYFSVVDFCAAICGSNYQSGRNYWKWLKNKLFNQDCPLVASIKQLKFEAGDGKLRYTDVMDAGEILQLILLFPEGKRSRIKAFRMWIAGLVKEGKPVKEFLSKAAFKVKDMTRLKVGGFMRTIWRERFDVLFDGDDCDLPTLSCLPGVA